jgi:hypothetical protein
MMKESSWKSVEDFITEFSLKREPHEIDGIVRDLKERKRHLHPDRTGGKFSSLQEEETFHRLEQALNYVKTMRSVSLAKHDSLALVIEAAVDKALARREQVEAKGTEQEISLISKSREVSRRRHVFPRISSGVLFLVSAFCFTVQSRIEAVPALRSLGQSRVFSATSLLVALISAVFFVLTWLSERKAEENAEYMTSEEGLRNTLAHLGDSLLSTSAEQMGTKLRFAITDYFSAIRSVGRQGPLERLMGSGFGPRLTEDLANSHIQKLLQRHLVEEDHESRMDRQFLVEEKLAKHWQDIYYRDFYRPDPFWASIKHRYMIWRMKRKTRRAKS